MLRLRTLQIKGYKNIKDVEFDFSSNQGLIALVGENGSGKSNLLEAVSQIFNSFLQDSSTDFDYKLDYFYDDNDILILKNSDGVDIRMNGTKITLDEFRRNLFPSRIIANYSGEDMRLFNDSYKPSYDKYRKQLMAVDELPSLPMIYINKYYWSLCLLSLYFLDHSAYTDLADFCKKQLGIEKLKDIAFEVDLDVAAKWKNNEPRQLLQVIFGVESFSEISNFDNSNDKGIAILEERRKKTAARIVLPLEEFKARIDELNLDAKQFFLFLYAAFTPKDNKLLKDLKINLVLTNGTVLGLDGLSEGEKKLILIKFITTIIGDDKSIVLLDEPDAHTHISRKKELLNAVKSFEGQTILTTHSPVFVNEIHRQVSDSLFFIKDGGPENKELIFKLVELSGGLLDYIGGSVVFASKDILALEGLSDIKCIRKAIDVFADKDSKYGKLKNIQLLSFGGTGNASEMFTQVLSYHMNHIEHLVYLFDNDHAGKDGYKAMQRILKEDQYIAVAPKVKMLYYDDTQNNIEIEWLISPDAYKDLVDTHHLARTYKEYKQMMLQKKFIVEEIKKRIKDKVDSFEPDWFDDFRPVLDKLLDAFELK